MAWEYYTFLGIRQDAGLDEIKLAAARKRRELEIARDTAGKAYLNEVTQVLRDPQARAEYDALQQGGAQLQQFLTQATEAENLGNWPEAVRLYRQALILVPDHPLVLNRLAFAQAESGNFREAEKEYASLVKRFPESPVYWASYGAVCLTLAKRIASQQAPSGELVDLMLTGIQSAKRLTALQAISQELGTPYESAKLLAKQIPTPLATFLERGTAENISRTLRAAGALVKVVPSEGKAIQCPYCAYTLYLPAEEGGRSATCQYCMRPFRLYKGDRDALLRQGRENYARAIALDPTNASYYTSIADSYSENAQYAEAAEWTEKEILADGTEDFDDLSALVELTRLYLLLGQTDAVEKTVKRIRAVMPDKKAVTRRSVGNLFSLAGLTEALHQQYAIAKALVEIGLRFVPDDPGLLDALRLSGQLDAAHRELKAMLNDNMIVQEVRDIARVLVTEASMQRMDETQAMRLERSFDKLYDYGRNVIRASVKRIKTKYPGVYALTRHYFDQVLSDEPLQGFM